MFCCFGKLPNTSFPVVVYFRISPDSWCCNRIPHITRQAASSETLRACRLPRCPPSVVKRRAAEETVSWASATPVMAESCVRALRSHRGRDAVRHPRSLSTRAPGPWPNSCATSNAGLVLRGLQGGSTTTKSRRGESQIFHKPIDLES